jgi:4-hydroxybenzoate polyprenyltransferase
VNKKIIAVLRLLRPTQWVKNVFLFAPLIFSKHLFEPAYFRLETLAFVCFCILSSIIYIVNDISDRDVDRLHPIKRKRPLASGVLSIAQSLSVAGILVVILVALSSPLNARFWLAAGLYAVLNFGYSFWLKKVVLLDVFIIAAGFMLRVLAGVFAIDVVISPWLVLCTLFVSVFLATSKRRGELMLSTAARAYDARPVLREYDVAFMDQIMTIAASGMAISYALYTVAERTVSTFGTENLIFTTVFVLFGIFRYIFLVRDRKKDDNPMHLLLSDIPMVVNVLAWFIACVLIIYSHEISFGFLK